MRSLSRKPLSFRKQALHWHLQSCGDCDHLEVGHFSSTAFEAKQRGPVQVQAPNLKPGDQVLLSHPGMRSQP